MSTLQIKRGASDAVSNYTPKDGELILDTTNYRLVIGDGKTIGGVPLNIKTGTSGDNVPLLSGINTWSASQTFSASGTTFKNASGTTGLEIGSTSSAQNSYLDFHTSGNNTDYDSRLMFSGGTTTIGNGAVVLTAATFNLSGVFTSSGVTDASSAATGKVGEFLEATGSAVSIAASGTVYNIVTLSLSAGDWDVDGCVGIVCSAGGTTMFGGISLTSATSDGFPYSFNAAHTFSASNQRFSLPTRRVNIKATTTVYGVATAGFSSGTASASMYLRARRVR
ncbi:hypothetical protein PUG46_19650 [Erwiniaceae bacterium L1_55_4]|nr:hypothetical protein [Erwiniaceae bacterium L1_55_4]